MTRVLYIEASPRKQLSASIEVAQAALAAVRQSIPDVAIDKLLCERSGECVGGGTGCRVHAVARESGTDH